MHILKLLVILKTIALPPTFASYKAFARPDLKATINPDLQRNICLRTDTWSLIASIPLQKTREGTDLFYLQPTSEYNFKIDINCITFNDKTEFKNIRVTCRGNEYNQNNFYNTYLVQASSDPLMYQYTLKNIDPQNDCQNETMTFFDLDVISSDVWYLFGWQDPTKDKDIVIALLIFRVFKKEEEYSFSEINNIVKDVLIKVEKEYFLGTGTGICNRCSNLTGVVQHSVGPNNDKACKKSPSIDYSEIKCMTKSKTLNKFVLNLTIAFGCLLLVTWIVIMAIIFKRKNKVTPATQVKINGS